MTFVALAISLALAALGALGVASPRRLLAVVRSFQTPAGIWAAAGLRLVLGVALYLAAPEARTPGLLRILGVFIAVAGIATPFFGLDRFRRLLDWWSAEGDAFVRTWAAFACAFGLGLAYALVPGP
jgi:hypothetical protein